MHIEQHNSEYLEHIILNKLTELTIDIKNCRGQSYDNAANMSGKYSGLQTRIRNHSATAFYIPCANHSLNLVGNCAAESSTAAILYFDFVQKLFTFFSASTKRWNMLSKLPLVLKRISDTRWSARADAVLALKSGYHKIRETLKNISTSPDEKLICRLEASTLANKFDDYGLEQNFIAIKCY